MLQIWAASLTASIAHLHITLTRFRRISFLSLFVFPPPRGRACFAIATPSGHSR
ncbi:hypothetical protein ACFC0M_05890 [Streptomyces sp. NPDC056149]|uniref:hypothetical protein n=1 Tax=Streptomyces sp. NPDC056149 TaxID=3345728 RepID=UPI0035E2AE25